MIILNVKTKLKIRIDLLQPVKEETSPNTTKELTLSQANTKVLRFQKKSNIKSNLSRHRSSWERWKIQIPHQKWIIEKNIKIWKYNLCWIASNTKCLGLLQETLWTWYKLRKVEFRFIVVDSYSLIGRLIKGQNAYIPAQQNPQNIKPHLSAKLTLYWSLRQPNQRNVKLRPAFIKSAFTTKKSHIENKRDKWVTKIGSIGPSQ